MVSFQQLILWEALHCHTIRSLFQSKNIHVHSVYCYQYYVKHTQFIMYFSCHSSITNPLARV